jgi:hypothetical protein
MQDRRSFAPQQLGMRTKSWFTLKWTGNVLIFWLFLTFIPSVCAKGQALPDSGINSPGYELARTNFEGRYGTLVSDFNPSLPSRRSFPDLKVDQLHETSKRGLVGSDSAVVVPPAIESKPDVNVRWRPAIQESLLYTGIMHTFNIWTEPGTRDALHGPWLRDYLDSVGELRGWSDSDRFMAPYIGHTIEGSIFGFIERQNDPRYRKVQWGDGRPYYMSLLHSLAYSAIWHTQWKIGPASEASIGNVMLHASPGFITLADTPTLGTIEMIGEDAADRYLIMGLENRTYNGIYIALARTFLNPGRSFANVMAFKLPWHREDRIGVNAEEYLVRKELLAEYKAGGEKPFEYVRLPQTEDDREHPKEADIELTAFPVYETFIGHGGSCVGGGGSGASRVNPSLQLIGEVSGCLIMHMPASDQSADSLFYGGGVRWTPLADHRISPYVQVMFGGKKVTHETDNIPLRTQLLAEWNDGHGTIPHYPKRSDWSVEVANNGPALGFGGGFDVVLARPFAWRLVDFQYSHTWIGDVGAIHPQDTIRITTGAVLRIGTW